MGIDLAGKWQDAADREKESRALFAQHSVRAEQVYDIWSRSEKELGTDRLMHFLHTAFRTNGIPTGTTLTGALSVYLSSLEAKRRKIDEVCDSDTDANPLYNRHNQLITHPCMLPELLVKQILG